MMGVRTLSAILVLISLTVLVSCDGGNGNAPPTEPSPGTTLPDTSEVTPAPALSTKEHLISCSTFYISPSDEGITSVYSSPDFDRAAKIDSLQSYTWFTKSKDNQKRDAFYRILYNRQGKEITGYLMPRDVTDTCPRDRSIHVGFKVKTDTCLYREIPSDTSDSKSECLLKAGMVLLAHSATDALSGDTPHFQVELHQAPPSCSISAGYIPKSAITKGFYYVGEPSESVNTIGKIINDEGQRGGRCAFTNDPVTCVNIDGKRALCQDAIELKEIYLRLWNLEFCNTQTHTRCTAYASGADYSSPRFLIDGSVEFREFSALEGLDMLLTLADSGFCRPDLSNRCQIVHMADTGQYEFLKDGESIDQNPSLHNILGTACIYTKRGDCK